MEIKNTEATLAAEKTEATTEEATVTSPEGKTTKLCPSCTELLKQILEQGVSITSITEKTE